MVWSTVDGEPGEAERDLPEGYDRPGKWKIFSDGSPNGTRLIDPYGREVPGIYRIAFEIEADTFGGGGRGVATVELAPMLTDLTHISADVVTFTTSCPACGETHSHKCGPPF